MSVKVGEDGSPQVNKFEQVSSDDHQKSVAGGWVPRSDVQVGVPRFDVQGGREGGIPYPMMHLMLLTPL